MEKTYPIPRKFRAVSLLILQLLALAIVLLLAGECLDAWKGDWPAILLVVAILALIALIPLGLLDFYHGEVILTDDEIILRRWRRERRLRYQDVTATKLPLYNLPPEFSLRAGRRRIGIPTQIEQFSEIYAILCEKVPVLRRETQAGFPYRLVFTAGGLGFYVFGIVMLLAMWLGFSWGLVLLTSTAITFETLRTVAILFLLLGFFFAPAIYVSMVGLFSGSISFRQPAAWEFTPEQIRFRYVFGPWLSRPVSDLAGVELEALPVTVRVSHEGQRVTEQAIRYTLRLHFSSGFPAKMEINSDRAIQYGATLHQIAARLCHLYSLPDWEPGAAPSLVAPVNSSAGRPAALELRVDASIARNVTLAVLFFCGGGLLIWVLYFSFVFWPNEMNDARDMWSCWPIGLFFWGLGLLAYYAYYFPRQPSRWIFAADQIRFRYPLGGWQSRDARDLQRIALVAKKETRFVPDGAGEHQPALVAMHHVVLTFANGDELTITQDRITQFGATPERVFSLLREHYPQIPVAS